MVFKWFLAFGECNGWGYEINFRQFHGNWLHLVFGARKGERERKGLRDCCMCFVFLFSSVSDLLNTAYIPMKNTSDWTMICQSLTWVWFFVPIINSILYFYLWCAPVCDMDMDVFVFCASLCNVHNLFVILDDGVSHRCHTATSKHQSGGCFVVALTYFI